MGKIGVTVHKTGEKRKSPHLHKEELMTMMMAMNLNFGKCFSTYGYKHIYISFIKSNN